MESLPVVDLTNVVSFNKVDSAYVKLDNDEVVFVTTNRDALVTGTLIHGAPNVFGVERWYKLPQENLKFPTKSGFAWLKGKALGDDLEKAFQNNTQKYIAYLTPTINSVVFAVQQNLYNAIEDDEEAAAVFAFHLALTLYVLQGNYGLVHGSISRETVLLQRGKFKAVTVGRDLFAPNDALTSVNLVGVNLHDFSQSRIATSGDYDDSDLRAYGDLVMSVAPRDSAVYDMAQQLSRNGRLGNSPAGADWGFFPVVFSQVFSPYITWTALPPAQSDALQHFLPLSVERTRFANNPRSRTRAQQVEQQLERAKQSEGKVQPHGKRALRETPEQTKKAQEAEEKKRREEEAKRLAKARQDAQREQKEAEEARKKAEAAKKKAEQAKKEAEEAQEAAQAEEDARAKRKLQREANRKAQDAKDAEEARKAAEARLKKEQEEAAEAKKKREEEERKRREEEKKREEERKREEEEEKKREEEKRKREEEKKRKEEEKEAPSPLPTYRLDDHPKLKKDLKFLIAATARDYAYTTAQSGSALDALDRAMEELYKLYDDPATKDAYNKLVGASLLVTAAGKTPYNPKLSIGPKSEKADIPVGNTPTLPHGTAPRYFATPVLLAAVLFGGYPLETAITDQTAIKEMNTRKNSTPVADRLLGAVAALGLGKEELKDEPEEEFLEETEEEPPEIEPAEETEEEPEAELSPFKVTTEEINANGTIWNRLFGTFGGKARIPAEDAGRWGFLLSKENISGIMLELLGQYSNYYGSPANKNVGFQVGASKNRRAQFFTGVDYINKLATELNQIFGEIQTEYELPLEFITSAQNVGLLVYDEQERKYTVPQFATREDEQKAGKVFPAVSSERPKGKTEVRYGKDREGYQRLAALWGLALGKLMAIGILATKTVPGPIGDAKANLDAEFARLYAEEEAKLVKQGRKSFLVEPNITITAPIQIAPGVIADHLAARGLGRVDVPVESVETLQADLLDAMPHIVDSAYDHPDGIHELPSVRNALASLELCRADTGEPAGDFEGILRNTTPDEQIEYGRRLHLLATLLDRIHVTGNGSFSNDPAYARRIDVVTPFARPWRKTQTRSTMSI